MADKIDVPIDAKVLFQMFEYAAYAKHIFGTEIAGWGHYNREDGIYKLAPLPKQIVSGAEVDTFPDEIIKDQTYDISDMVVQWHSHVDMGVTPSWTDKKQIKDALELYSYIISIIVNCKNQYYAELNIKRSGEMSLPSAIQLEVNLVPYYNNPEVKKTVKKQCRRPAPVVYQHQPRYQPPGIAEGSVSVKQQRGWNPHYGQGLYVGNNFYPDNGSFYVKDVVWNPLKNSWSREKTGEIIIPLKYVEKPDPAQLNAFQGDDLNYFPTAQEMALMNKDAVETAKKDKHDELLSEKDIKILKEKAVELDKARGNDFQMICQGGTYWIQHLKSSTYCEINDHGEVLVQGELGNWNEFLKRVGALDEQFWYSPGDCIACNATGKSSKGKVCKACDGKGKVTPN